MGIMLNNNLKIGYPTFIQNGSPTHHHLVIYFYAKITNDELLQQKINIQKDEVDEYSWLSKENIKNILNNNFENQFFHSYSFNPEKNEYSMKDSLLLELKDQRTFNKCSNDSCLTMGTIFSIQQYVNNMY
jgi:hypothetical protein